MSLSTADRRHLQENRNLLEFLSLQRSIYWLIAPKTAALSATDFNDSKRLSRLNRIVSQVTRKMTVTKRISYKSVIIEKWLTGYCQNVKRH